MSEQKIVIKKSKGVETFQKSNGDSKQNMEIEDSEDVKHAQITEKREEKGKTTWLAETEDILDDIKKVEIEINALIKLLNDMEREYERANIDTAQYFRMRLDYLKQQEFATEKLNIILREKGAGALADVVEKLPESRDDQKLRTDLERAAKEGETKGWGLVIRETIEKEKGPIAQTILKVAIKVASFIL